MIRNKKSPNKLPKLNEIPGWRKEKTTKDLNLQPTVISPYTNYSKKEYFVSPRYPKELKLPPLN